MSRVFLRLKKIMIPSDQSPQLVVGACMRTRWIFVVLQLLQQIRRAQISQASESWSGLEVECIFISFWFELDSFQLESFTLPVWRSFMSQYQSEY